MAIRAAVLTSTAPRHLYFLQVLSGAFDIAAGLTQPKRAYYAAQRENSAAVRAHFAALAEADHAEFSPRLNGDAAKMREVADINNPALVEEIAATGAEVVFLFGTEILAPCWLDAFPDRIINLHLGLSPYYRGSATLFWPCANGEPECVGATIHLAVQKVDAGALLARIKVDPEIGDSYYSLTNRMIRRAIDAFPQIASDYLAGRITPEAQAGAAVRAYRKADFDDEALARMLAFFGPGLSARQVEAAKASGKCPC